MEKVNIGIIGFLKNNKHQVLLVLLILLVLFPLSFFILIPKWDNINGYLPYRYFISDYLWNGHLPLWNPSQRLGFPGYTDLQSGCWNPIVWVLMLFGKYTITTLIVELLLCYIIAGLGMFKLSNFLFKCNKTSFILGFSYALSGFMVGTSQMMVFLVAAAWFPFIIYFLLKYFESKQLKYQLLTVLSMALYITSASPAYTVVLAYIVVAIFAYKVLANKKEAKQIILGGLLILGGLTVILLPYINSFIEVAAYFSRAEKLEYDKFLLQNPFTPISYISFIFPQGVIASTNIFNITDITLRNGYFGIVGLFCFLTAFTSRWNRTKVVLLVGVIVSLILSAGGETFLFEYVYYLPGFGVFRHPSMYRVFTIFCCLLLAGYELKNIIEHGFAKKHKIIAGGLALTVIIAAILTFNKSSIDQIIVLLKNTLDLVELSKSSLSTHVLLNSLVLIIIGIVAFILYKGLKISLVNTIIFVVLVDISVQSMLTIPTTICYNIKEDTVAQFFDNLPNEINQNDNYTPLKYLDETQELHKTGGIWNNVSTFNKTLSFVGVNPMRFKSFDEAEKDGRLEEAIENNILYISDNSETKVGDILIDYNKFSGIVKESDKVQKVILNQNYHHLWNAKFNDKVLPIKKYKDLTMSVEIPSNTTGKIEFEYKSPRTIYTFIISLLGYLTLIVLLIKNRKITS